MRGKKIILGVTGSIAAYKSASLIRLLVKEGADVRVIMTESAKDFITPLTLSVLSGAPVTSESFERKSGVWNSHVAAGLWADVLIIAPASANTIAKMSHGLADNHLLEVYLSARCPVFIAPAMDLDMWMHPTTKENISRLLNFGHHIIQPAEGELASGLTGPGRMEEPEKIATILKDFFLPNHPLTGKKALVTAGPTYEAIDPVRFIGNRSSGKMGFAIAEELLELGADVTLITGPTNLKCSSSIKRIDIENAEDMYQACVPAFSSSDITIMSAAVADFKPEIANDSKIKKRNNSLSISLVPTPDILSTLGEKKKEGQILVGFALETDNEIANAEDKLKRKNLDVIVLNSLKDEGAGFNVATNKVTIITRNGELKPFTLKPKTEVAKDIVQTIIGLIKK